MCHIVQLLQNFCRTMSFWQVLKSQFLCHLIICYVFLVSGLIVNAAQICTLPLWLLNKQVARRINIRLAYCISSRKSALTHPRSNQFTSRVNVDTHECLPKRFLNNWTMRALVVTEIVAVLEWWSGTECTLYTDPESYQLYGKENAIVLLNHRFELDFLCGWTFCERFGVLGVRTCAR